RRSLPTVIQRVLSEVKRAFNRRSRRARAAMAISVAPAGSLTAVAISSMVSAADEVTVTAMDVEDATTGTSTQSSDVDLEGPDLAEGGKALRIVDRDNDFEGIQSPTGIFEPGVTYTASMRARLADGTAGTPGVRFVAKPTFTWIGNAAVNADG